MKKLAAILMVPLLAVAVFLPQIGNASGVRDCDENAVIKCGALSKSELISKIERGDGAHSDLQKVFFQENRGITKTGIQNSVEGTVTKSGTVVVNGKVVAKGVFSSGRSFMPGSTRDGSLWMRPPSVSFRSDSLDAFVLMEGGTFKSAILKSCGNPIKILAAPFPQVFKRVQNERTGTESAADTLNTAIKAREGDRLHFTVTVSNNGTASAENVTITDNIPTGLNLTDPNKRVLTAGMGSITAENRKNIQIFMTVAPGTAGKCIENVAVMTATGGFKDQDSAFVCVERTVVQQLEQNLKIIKFEDIDHDGVQDSNESVLPGFTFRLDDGTTKVSDANGIVVFNSITAGSHKVEEINIPNGFIAIHQNPFNINVPGGATVTEKFGNQKLPGVTVVPPPEEEVVPAEKEFVEAPEQGAGAPAPEALPEAGPEALGAGILGTMALGLAGRNYLRSRKNLLDTLRKKK